MTTETTADIGKLAAARYAAQLVRDGAVIGLGTGSTAECFLRALGERIRADGLTVTGVPTSEVTAALARREGVTLTTLEHHPRLELAIDGADAVSVGALDLIKGYGGALLRERIVAASAARFVVIVDESKLVERLHQARGVPVEVVPFGWTRTRAELERLGAVTNLRQRPGAGPEAPFVTDGGHFIVDCRFPPVDDVVGLARAIKLLTGVVDHGLFVGMAHEVVVGAASGQVRVISRASP